MSIILRVSVGLISLLPNQSAIDLGSHLGRSANARSIRMDDSYPIFRRKLYRPATCSNRPQQRAAYQNHMPVIADGIGAVVAVADVGSRDGQKSAGNESSG